MYRPVGHDVGHALPIRYLPEIHDKHNDADVQVTHGDTHAVQT